jgi:hypothetical protein
MLCHLVIYRFYFRIFKSSGEYTIKPNFPSHRCRSICINYCFLWFWEELFTYLLLKYILCSLHSADITFCVYYAMFAPFLNEVNGKHCFCNVYLACDTRIIFYLHWLRKFYEGPNTSGGIEIDLEYQPLLLVSFLLLMSTNISTVMKNTEFLLVLGKVVCSRCRWEGNIKMCQYSDPCIWVIRYHYYSICKCISNCRQVLLFTVLYKTFEKLYTGDETQQLLKRKQQLFKRTVWILKWFLIEKRAIQVYRWNRVCP